MTARNPTLPFPFRRTALALALRQVLQERRWQAFLAAGLVGLAPASLGDPFPADLPLSSLDGTNGFKLSGVAAYEASGSSVSNAGDVNGDGLDDLLIGAPYADPFGTDPNNVYSGASYVVFGGVGGTGMLALASLDGSNGFRLPGAAAGDHSGRSVSNAGMSTAMGWMISSSARPSPPPTVRTRGRAMWCLGVRGASRRISPSRASTAATALSSRARRPLKPRASQ